MLSSLMSQEGQFPGDKKKIFSDYVSRIKSNRLKTQTESLRLQIQEAETSGNAMKLEQLIKEFSELIRK